MSLSRQVRDELDELEVNDVLEELLGYVAGRHRLLATGQRKLIALFEDGHLRKTYLELGMSPSAFENTAR